MFTDFDDQEPERDPFLYDATVTDRNDPEGLYRVRFEIPGKIEGKSQWAWPSATLGGGSKNRGFFAAPEVGGDITVWFNQGNLDEPRYMCAHWGKPDGESEVPSEAFDPDIRVLATETFRFEFDERDGHQAFRMVNLHNGDFIELDAVRNAVTIKGTTAVNIVAEGIVNIHSDTQVQVQGRPVAATPDPI